MNTQALIANLPRNLYDLSDAELARLMQAAIQARRAGQVEGQVLSEKVCQAFNIRTAILREIRAIDDMIFQAIGVRFN